MRLQTLLHGGPYDMDMVVVESVGGDWPPEIRVASRPGRATTMYEGKLFEAAVYRLISAEEVTTGVFFASYQFSGMRDTAATLVSVWN